LTVIGIAKDGHVVYGPYDSTGTQVIMKWECQGRRYFSQSESYNVINCHPSTIDLYFLFLR
jgi:hypothetical protein